MTGIETMLRGVWRHFEREPPPVEEVLLFEFTSIPETQDGQTVNRRVIACGCFVEDHWEYRDIATGKFIYNRPPLAWARLPDRAFF